MIENAVEIVGFGAVFGLVTGLLALRRLAAAQDKRLIEVLRELIAG